MNNINQVLSKINDCILELDLDPLKCLQYMYNGLELSFEIPI
jgi:hypothetical protein